MSRIGLTGALLIAFLVASGAPLMVFWLWPHSAALHSELREARERHLLLARAIADTLDRHHADLLTTFEVLAPRIAAGEDIDYAEPLLAALGLRHVCVLERDSGRVVADFLTAGAPCPLAAPPERLARFRALVADRPMALSPVDTTMGEPLLFLVRDAGPLLTVAAVRTGYFRELAAGIAFGRAGHAVIVDDHGRILAHPREDWTAQARDLSGLLAVRRLLAGDSGVETFISPSLDVEVIAGFAAAPNSGWGVMVPQPVSELQARARSVATSALVVFGAGLSLSAAFALVFSASLARPVRRLSEAARRMGRGEAGVRVAHDAGGGPFAEIAALAQAFNVMAQRVEAAHARILSVAVTDSLTGLANRKGFFEAAAPVLADVLADARAGGGEAALFFIDLDRFKAVNDAHGHAVGDALLRSVAARLRAVAGPGDLIARQGGDEFLLLHRCREPRGCALMGARLLRALQRPVQLDDHVVTVSVSIGVSAFPRDAADIAGLTLRADQAMYHAKRGGRRRIRRFDEGIRQRLDEEIALKRELRLAIPAGEVTAEFQPILRAADGGLAGFEALARWVSPSRGPIPAERFITLAEDSGQIVELGRRMRTAALAFAAQMRAGGAPLPVFVNVSPLELAHGGFAQQLQRQLAEAGLPPEAVTLEITETLFRRQSQRHLDSLFALRRRGVGFALDDFGKGFSSHSRLRAYPVDRLKITVDFLGDIVTDRRARAVVRSLVELGRNLGLTVTVEGIETEVQRDLVVAMGAHELQGFWRHPPMEAGAALALALTERAGRLRRAAGAP